MQRLKKGYSDAVNKGYEFGFEVYARDKFIQLVMDSRGIKGYQGTLPPEKIETKAEETDGKKTKTSEAQTPEVKEPVES